MAKLKAVVLLVLVGFISFVLFRLWKKGSPDYWYPNVDGV